MTAARFTQAEIRRAIRAARQEGCEAVELPGAVRILVKDTAPVLPSDDGEDAWDAKFTEEHG